MNKLKYLAFVLVLFRFYAASALTTLSGDVYGASDIFTDDILIEEGAALYVKDIYVDKTITIENNGFVAGDIYINAPYDLTVKNNGVFEGVLYADSDSELVQVVDSKKSLTRLNVDGNYIVNINSEDGLGLDDILKTVGGAKQISIRDSKIVLNDSVVESGALVQLDGEIAFYIDELGSADSVALLDNISSTANIIFHDMGTDVLYAQSGFISDGVLYVNRVRETDYTKVFDNELGIYLNDLRIKDQNDSLLMALDVANNMDDINRILRDSVRLNPIKLMRPVHSLLLLDSGADILIDGIGAGGEVIVGDGFDLYGAKINLGNSIGALSLGGSLGVGTMSVNEAYEEYDAMIYSGRIMAKYEFENRMFVRGAIETVIAAFGLEDVFIDNRVVDSPNGFAMSMDMDTGINLGVYDGISFSPFVGVVSEYMTIEDASDASIDLRAGAAVKFDYEMAGIKYEYGMRGALYSDMDYMIGARVSVWSDMDEVGGNADLALVNQDGHMSYKISLGASVKF